MKKLKVWDEIYHPYTGTDGAVLRYNFDIVESINKQFIVTVNGRKLLNKYTKQGREQKSYPSWNKPYWNIVTQEVISEYEDFMNKNKRNVRFLWQKFTNDQIEKIFNLFN